MCQTFPICAPLQFPHLYHVRIASKTNGHATDLDEHRDNDDDDPVVASYDIYLTDAKIRRILLQYPDRESDRLYNDSTYQKPTELRLKPETGLVEVDIPIDTITNYDERKGLRYGSALKQSNISQQGGTHGLAGGFNTAGSGGAGSRMKVEDAGSKTKIEGYADDEHELVEDEDGRDGVVMTQQTVGGRAKAPTDGDPIYLLGAFKNSGCRPVLLLYFCCFLPYFCFGISTRLTRHLQMNSI